MDTNTVCGALNSAITSIFSTTAKNKGNPLARLCVVTPAPWQSCTPDGINETSIMANKYVDAIIEICHLRGIPCLDLFHNSGLRPNEPTMYIESSGRTHLNEVGHQLIAPRYKAMLDTLIL